MMPARGAPEQRRSFLSLARATSTYGFMAENVS
jgi:hypothetical protein